MGATFLAHGDRAALAGVTPWGWLPVAAVVALQALLAATGFCLGCRLFFLRWWVPDRFARLIGRGIQREKLMIVEPPRDPEAVRGAQAAGTDLLAADPGPQRRAPPRGAGRTPPRALRPTPRGRPRSGRPAGRGRRSGPSAAAPPAVAAARASSTVMPRSVAPSPITSGMAPQPLKVPAFASLASATVTPASSSARAGGSPLRRTSGGRGEQGRHRAWRPQAPPRRPRPAAPGGPRSRRRAACPSSVAPVRASCSAWSRTPRPWALAAESTSSASAIEKNPRSQKTSQNVGEAARCHGRDHLVGDQTRVRRGGARLRRDGVCAEQGADHADRQRWRPPRR